MVSLCRCIGCRTALRSRNCDADLADEAIPQPECAAVAFPGARGDAAWPPPKPQPASNARPKRYQTQLAMLVEWKTRHSVCFVLICRSNVKFRYMLVQ